MQPGRSIPKVMLSAAYSLFSRLVPSEGIPRRDTATLCTMAILHVAALVIMAASEVDPVAKAAYLLVWGLLNFLWLTLFRRPVAAAVISLAFIVALILLSQFKHDKLWMTVDFVDLMIIDQDTLAFLLAVIPSLRLPIAGDHRIAIHQRLVVGRRIDVADHVLGQHKPGRIDKRHSPRRERPRVLFDQRQCFFNADHVAKNQTAKNWRRISKPACVRKLSGWNCTPNSGSSRWRIPMISR